MFTETFFSGFDEVSFLTPDEHAVAIVKIRGMKLFFNRISLI